MPFHAPNIVKKVYKRLVINDPLFESNSQWLKITIKSLISFSTNLSKTQQYSAKLIWKKPWKKIRGENETFLYDFQTLCKDHASIESHPNVLLLNRNQNMVDFTLLVEAGGARSFVRLQRVICIPSHPFQPFRKPNWAVFTHDTSRTIYASQFSKLMEIGKMANPHFILFKINDFKYNNYIIMYYSRLW